jgi:RNA polymerase sigma-70 factor, ECF subfamily
MSAVFGSSRATLQEILLSHYADFERRLTRQLGSADLAHDALQETYLRLQRDVELGPVHNPKSYLFRIAINAAKNLRKSDCRYLNAEQVETLLSFADDAPDPARTAEARSDMQALIRALGELPERRRAIFLASWVEDVPHQEIAARYGVTVRTVQIELKSGLEHCVNRLKK